MPKPNFVASPPRLTYGLCDFALLGFEYLFADTESDAPAHVFTTQLVIEF